MFLMTILPSSAKLAMVMNYNYIFTVTSTMSCFVDCASFLYIVGCSVERGGQRFDIPHGDFLIYVDDDDDDDDDDKSDSDGGECQRCLCSNGEAILCEPTNCTSLQPRGCSYQEQSYNHGDTFDVSSIK